MLSHARTRRRHSFRHCCTDTSRCTLSHRSFLHRDRKTKVMLRSVFGGDEMANCAVNGTGIVGLNGPCVYPFGRPRRRSLPVQCYEE